MIKRGYFITSLVWLVPAFLAVLPDLSTRAYAQDEYAYKRYEDRKEGILKEKKLVAGEKLELISAAIAPQEAQSQTQPGQYHLAFFMEDSNRVQVVVQALVPEIQRLYKMEPLFITHPKGVRTFSWPATIPLHYNLGVDKLLPLAKVRGAAGGKIVPVLLYSQSRKDAAPRYRFCFVPSGNLSVLKYHVYEANAATPIYSGALRDLPGEQQVFLNWDGRNQKGAPVKSGWYKLILEATFKALPGANPRKVSVQHEFYHYAEIFRKAGATQ